MSTDPVILPFSGNYWSTEGQWQPCQLVSCEDEKAPDRVGETTTMECKLIADLKSVPAIFWERRTNSREQDYEHLDFEVGMQIESGGLRFDLRIDDVVYGEVKANFDAV